eukprot:SAG11_NODE_235_length_11852_cov_4.266020_13_plen_136_part_00
MGIGIYDAHTLVCVAVCVHARVAVSLYVGGCVAVCSIVVCIFAWSHDSCMGTGEEVACKEPARPDNRSWRAGCGVSALDSASYLPWEVHELTHSLPDPNCRRRTAQSILLTVQQGTALVTSIFGVRRSTNRALFV